MSLKTVPLSSLLPPKHNPRHKFDPSLVAALAQSIRTDGVLQNLVVAPDGEKYRIVSGKRRYLALQQLKKANAIDGDYKVPVEIKRDLDGDESLRLATVENVQREPLHPVDEAHTFAKLLQTGGTVDDIAEKTGLSPHNIKRRLALASLCPEAKDALYSGAIPLRIAEVLTLGSEAQQKAILENIKQGYPLEPEEIRASFLQGKPTLAMAIFAKERYTGPLTSDLFASEETTYFDDAEQFFELQKEAVEALAEEHRQKAAWVEVMNLYSVPWWQYRKAKKREAAGVVINLHPSGAVEIREKLVKEKVKPEVVVETREERQPKERPTFSAPLLRYVAQHKSTAVQAALLANPRKAKEAAVCLLLWGTRLAAGGGIGLRPHDCLSGLRDKQPTARAYREIEAVAARLSDRLAIPISDIGSRAKDGVERLVSGELGPSLWEVLGKLADEDLDRLLVLLPILCFGQETERPDADEGSLFNRVAADLVLNMRDWWLPEATFLASLRREQLGNIIQACDAASRFSGFNGWSKTELVEALVRFFAAAAEGKGEGDGCDQARSWFPGLMRFPASDTLKTDAS